MTEMPPDSRFEVDREAVARYFFRGQVLSMLVIGIWLFGLGLIAAIVHIVYTGPRLTRRQAAELSYWLDGSTLRIDQGVFFLKRKSIPLDRITDVVVVQGPLMRWCGIWGLQVQTAGSGQGVPEATLFGLTEAEQVRDLIMAERDRIA